MAAPVEPLSAFPLYQPLPRPYRGPIADAHMHARDAAAMENYWTVARLYGIHYACPIVELPVALELQQRYGDHVRPIVWGIRPRQENFQDLGAFRRKKEALLEAIAQHGWRWVKLWFTPRFLYWHRVWLDDPHLDFFFERMARLHLNLLVHVADPDVWFVREHGDRAREVKRQHYLQLERRLQAYPHMVFQLAHFAGYPEDLDFLDRLLERYPQVVLDSSATKWVAREFSRHGERARRFMVRWQERIVFGTDLVAHPEREKEGTARPLCHALLCTSASVGAGGSVRLAHRGCRQPGAAAVLRIGTARRRAAAILLGQCGASVRSACAARRVHARGHGWGPVGEQRRCRSVTGATASAVRELTLYAVPSGRGLDADLMALLAVARCAKSTQAAGSA